MYECVCIYIYFSASHNLPHLGWSSGTKMKAIVLPDLQPPELSRRPPVEEWSSGANTR